MLFGLLPALAALVMLGYSGYIAFLYGFDSEKARFEAGEFWPIVALVMVIAFPVTILLVLAGAVVKGLQADSQ